MNRSRLRTLGVITLIGLAMVAASLWLAPLPSRLQQPDSQTVLWRDGSLAHTFLSPDQRWRLAGVIERVDPSYLTALLTIEDERFAHHLGVDPLAVLRALRSNLARGRIVSGASTLTMQLARLLEPKPRRWRANCSRAGARFSCTHAWVANRCWPTTFVSSPLGVTSKGSTAPPTRTSGTRRRPSMQPRSPPSSPSLSAPACAPHRQRTPSGSRRRVTPSSNGFGAPR